MLKSVLLFLLLGIAVYEIISVTVLIVQKVKAKKSKQSNIDKK